MLPGPGGGIPSQPGERELESYGGPSAFGDRTPLARGGTGAPSLFGFTGKGLRTLGIVLLAIGLVVFLGGASYMMSSVSAPSAFTDPTAWFNESTSHAMTGFAILAVGMVLLGLGGWALRFGLIQPVASFVAEEASPAIETASRAVGRGLGEARQEFGTPPATSAVQTVVKVKCKNCGYLDSEDATYCSKCGQPL